MNTVLDDWKIHCLRVQRPYINFDFENPSLLNTKLLQLPTNDQPAIYREMEDTNVMGVVDYDDDDGGRSYLRNSYDNIKEVIKKIAHKERHVVVYGFVGDYGYRDVAFLNHHYDLGYLKKNIRNKKEDNGVLKGYCNTHQLLKIIYGSLALDFAGRYANHDEYIKHTIPVMLLFYFPHNKLFFHVYDTRGGIVCSENDDKNILRMLFVKFKDKLNPSYMDDMTEKLKTVWQPWAGMTWKIDNKNKHPMVYMGLDYEDKTDKDKINIIKCKDSSLIPNVVISNSCTRKLYIERMNEKEEILKNGRKVWTVVNGQWIVTRSKK